jgi:hypothetical protein
LAKEIATVEEPFPALDQESSENTSADASSQNLAKAAPKVIAQNTLVASNTAATATDESLTALSGGNIVAENSQVTSDPTTGSDDPSGEVPLDPALDSAEADPVVPNDPAGAPDISGSEPVGSSSTVAPIDPKDPQAVRANPQSPTKSDTVASPEAITEKQAEALAEIKSGSTPQTTQTVGPSAKSTAPFVTGTGTSKAADTAKSPTTTESDDVKVTTPKEGTDDKISSVWSVSMFSSASEEEARSVLNKLKSFKPEGVLYLNKVTDKAGNLITRVRLGFFKEKEKADQVAKDLAEKAKTPSDHWSSNPTESEVKDIGAPIIGEEKK